MERLQQRNGLKKEEKWPICVGTRARKEPAQPWHVYQEMQGSFNPGQAIPKHISMVTIPLLRDIDRQDTQLKQIQTGRRNYSKKVTFALGCFTFTERDGGEHGKKEREPAL